MNERVKEEIRFWIGAVMAVAVVGAALWFGIWLGMNYGGA